MASTKPASSPFPRDYASWRRCIEHDCRQPLTPDFFALRLATLRAPGSAEAREFARLYGESHLRDVIAWFEQAAAERAPVRA
jgi:hypothetical protein